jgi:uncharacterized protein
VSRTDALIFNVAGLLAEGLGSVRTYSLDGITLDLDDLRQSQPIEGRVHLSRTNRGLFVSARARTSLEGTCSRCLRPIEIPIAIELDEEALPTIDIGSGAPVETEGEELDALRLTDHHELDLENEIREAIQLAEPIAPLCRPDCPGLCPTCGEELATGPHEHGPEAVDPRLAALQQFRVDGERKPD